MGPSTNRAFEFYERSRLFIGTHHEPFAFVGFMAAVLADQGARVAVCVSVAVPVASGAWRGPV
jgi:hypothetical protein